MAKGKVIEVLLAGLIDNNGAPLNGGTVQFYAAGTTTPQVVYTDEALSIAAANPYTLNSVGQAQLYANADYKLVIRDSGGSILRTWDNLSFYIDNFPSNTFVDASDYGGTMDDTTIQAAITAIAGASRKLFLKPGTWTIANNLTIPSTITLVPARGATISVSNTKTLTINGQFEAGIYAIFSGSGTVVFGSNTIVEAFPQWWSADGAGIQKAITASRVVRIPRGTYVASVEIIVANDYQQVICDNAIIQAGVGNIAVIRWSASYGRMSGNLKLDANGFTLCSGLRVCPQNESQVITVVNQSYNSFADILITGFDTGLCLKSGPKVGGVSSLCESNRFRDFTITSTTTGVFLSDGPNAGSNGPGSNIFHNLRVDSGANIGVKITGGADNIFYAPLLVNIATGSLPTAINIAAAGVYSSISGNTFYSTRFASCTTNITNADPTTRFIDTDQTLFAGGVYPRIAPMLLFRQVASTGPTNTTVNTTLLSSSIPGGLLGDHRRLQLKLFGTFYNFVGMAQTFYIAVELGAQLLASKTISLANYAGLGMWTLDVQLSQGGAVNSQNAFAQMVVTDASAGTANGVMTTPLNYLFGGYALSTVDMTVAQTLRVSATLGSASASLYAKALSADVTIF